MSCPHRFTYVGRANYAVPGRACERPTILACTVCGERTHVSCNSTRSETCTPCGLGYRDLVRRVARVHAGQLLMITLTAPGKPGHKRNVGGTYTRRRGPDGKMHGQWEGGSWHVCGCTPEGFDLAEWNATASARWNRFWANDVQRRPAFAFLHGAPYFRAAETQKRGALHFHILVQLPAGTAVPPDFPRLLREFAEGHGFGHVCDVEAVEGHRAAGYVAKYVAKGSNDRPFVPWRKTRTRKVRAPRIKAHPRYVQNEWVRLGPDPEYRELEYESRRASYRTWSCSRNWPRSMRDIRDAQAHYAALTAALPPWREGVEYGQSYEGVVALLADRLPVRPDLPDDEGFGHLLGDAEWHDAWCSPVT